MSQDDMVDSVVEAANAGSTSEPTKTRSLGDDWYLLSSQALEESRAPAEKEPAERYSKRSVVAAAIAVMLIGAAAAWFIFNFGHAGSRVPQQSIQNVSTSPGLPNRQATVQLKTPPVLPAQTPAVKPMSVTNDEELARLKKENRRLVALVEVLRRQSRNNQNCSGPEQNGPSKK